ncbi:MAG: dihydrodipicolinate synthase family protein [Bacteroidota bacterium]
MSTTRLFPPLKGLIAAPFTAFHQDGQLDLETIEQQCQLLVEDGVIGAFICGTTGEGLSLSIAERKSVAESWMRIAPADFKVIVHVGHNSLIDARDLAAHAEAIGAWGIGGFSPFFFSVTTAELLAELCGEIAAAAPSLPFYYYHIPSLTGVHLPMRDFLQAAHGHIPNLAGIKYSHGDLMDMRLSRAFAEGRYELMFGSDEILLSALALGVTAGVGSTYNYAAPLFHKVIQEFDAGNMEAAHRYQLLCMQMVEVLLSYRGGTTFGKIALKHRGVDCGPCRLPLKSISAQEEADIHRALNQLGFWEALEAAR